MRISDWSSDVCSSDLSTPQQGLQPRRAMGIRRGIGQFRRGMSAFVACRFPSPAASLSSLTDHRIGIAMTAFSFVTRSVFAWCVFYLVVMLLWPGFGLVRKSGVEGKRVSEGGEMR